MQGKTHYSSNRCYLCPISGYYFRKHSLKSIIPRPNLLPKNRLMPMLLYNFTSVYMPYSQVWCCFGSIGVVEIIQDYSIVVFNWGCFSASKSMIALIIRPQKKPTCETTLEHCISVFKLSDTRTKKDTMCPIPTGGRKKGVDCHVS